jgi:uncharacterized OB-fold protein
MSERIIAPDLTTLEIPMDVWTQPFWDASAKEFLRAPRCSQCARFRWPPGPFCPHCQSQRTEWLDPGPAILYSYTIIRDPKVGASEASKTRVPALVEFPQADRIRLLTALTDTALSAVRIDAQLQIVWVPAASGRVPLFRIPDE